MHYTRRLLPLSRQNLYSAQKGFSCLTLSGQLPRSGRYRSVRPDQYTIEIFECENGSQWEHTYFCYFCQLHRFLYRAIECVDHPDSRDAALFPLQSSKLFPFRRQYPLTGGSSGKVLMNSVSFTLKPNGSSI